MKTTLLTVLTIVFLNANAQTGISNLDFENWANSPFGYAPAGFTGEGLSYEITDPQHGSSYVRITSNATPGIYKKGSLFTNDLTIDGLYVPYTERPVALTGYIRTNIVGEDTVMIFGHMKNSGTHVAGMQRLDITRTITKWQQVTIPFTYYSQDAPDRIQLVFLANKNYFSNKPVGNNGTYLELDNFSLLTTTSISDFSQYGILLSAYPNPASNDFYLDINTDSATALEIYDLNGRLITKQSVSQKTTHVNVAEYTNGIYIYKLLDKENRILKTDKFNVFK